MLLGGQVLEELLGVKDHHYGLFGIWSYRSLDAAPPAIGPNSLDVRLAPVVLKMTPSSSPINPAEVENSENIYEKLDITESGILLNPGDFLLGSAMESIDCSTPIGLNSDTYVQHYDGRSTMARLGIQSHVSAGFGDYGFRGAFTLEICNHGVRPVQLFPGMRIGQVYFTQAFGPKLYSGYDQTNFEPQLPRLGKGRF